MPYTGNFIRVGSSTNFGIGESLTTGLAASDGQLYMSSFNNLYRFNLSGGEPTGAVNNLGNTFFPNGALSVYTSIITEHNEILYGITRYNNEPAGFSFTDPITANIANTYLNSDVLILLQFDTDMASDATNLVAMASTETVTFIYKVDTPEFERTYVGPPSAASINKMKGLFHDGDNFYAIGDDYIYRIEINFTANTTVVTEITGTSPDNFTAIHGATFFNNEAYVVTRDIAALFRLERAPKANNIPSPAFYVDYTLDATLDLNQYIEDYDRVSFIDSSGNETSTSPYTWLSITSDEIDLSVDGSAVPQIETNTIYPVSLLAFRAQDSTQIDLDIQVNSLVVHLTYAAPTGIQTEDFEIGISLSENPSTPLTSDDFVFDYIISNPGVTPNGPYGSGDSYTYLITLADDVSGIFNLSIPDNLTVTTTNGIQKDVVPSDELIQFQYNTLETFIGVITPIVGTQTENFQMTVSIPVEAYSFTPYDLYILPDIPGVYASLTNNSASTDFVFNITLPENVEGTLEIGFSDAAQVIVLETANIRRVIGDAIFVDYNTYGPIDATVQSNDVLQDGDFDIFIDFDDTQPEVTDFTAADIDVVIIPILDQLMNQPVLTKTGEHQYKLPFIVPEGEAGTVSVSIKDDARVTSGGGRAINVTNTQPVMWYYSTTSVIATISEVPGLNTEDFDIPITLSETSANFDISDLIIDVYSDSEDDIQFSFDGSGTDYTLTAHLVTENITGTFQVGIASDARVNIDEAILPLIGVTKSFEYFTFVDIEADIETFDVPQTMDFVADIRFSDIQPSITDFDIDDIDIVVTSTVGDPISTPTFVMFSAYHYQLNFEIPNDVRGTIEIGIAENATVDSGFTRTITGNTSTIEYDTTDVTATIQALPELQTSDFDIHITLSETSTDFTVMDFTTEGELSGVSAEFNGSGTDYVISFYLTECVASTFQLGIHQYATVTSNGITKNVVGETQTFSYNTFGDLEAIIVPPDHIVTGDFSVPVTVEQSITDLTLADFDITITAIDGTSISQPMLTGEGMEWSLDFTVPDGVSGSVEIAISDTAEISFDGGFTRTLIGSTVTAEYNTVDVCATIATITPIQTQNFDIDVTLSEDSTLLTLDDFDIIGDTTDVDFTITGENSAYTIAVGLTGTVEGTFEIHIAEGATVTAQDSIRMLEGMPASFVYNTYPTIQATIHGNNDIQKDDFDIIVNVPEPATNLGIDDFTITGHIENISATILGDGEWHIITVSLLDSSSGTIEVGIADNAQVTVDGVSTILIGNTESFSYNTYPPIETVIGTFDDVQRGDFNVPITFNQMGNDVIDFDLDDLDITVTTTTGIDIAPDSVTGEGIDFQLMFSLPDEVAGSVEISISDDASVTFNGVAREISGNTSTVEYTTTSVFVTFIDIDDLQLGNFDVTLTLSERLEGLGIEHFGLSDDTTGADIIRIGGHGNYYILSISLADEISGDLTLDVKPDITIEVDGFDRKLKSNSALTVSYDTAIAVIDEGEQTTDGAMDVGDGTLENIKNYSYQGYKSIWELEIASKLIPHSRIISVTDLEQQLDYPNLNEFTVGTVTIVISDPDSELSPHNETNYFVKNRRPQSGYRTPITVKAGFEVDGEQQFVALFVGEITQISEDLPGATISIQATDRTQELRNKNIVNFGITKTLALEPKDSRTHGNYPVPTALQEISQHSITRLYSADSTPDRQPDRTFLLYPGVGDPPYVGPRSPYLYEQEKLQTEGDLEESKFYEVTSEAVKIERGELESDLTITGKVPFRYKRVDEIIKEILNHVEKPDPSVVAPNNFDHQKFKDPTGTAETSLTVKFKGQLDTHPTNLDDYSQDDFYYNTTDDAFYLYDNFIWYTDIDYSNNPKVENNFTLINSRARVDARLNALGFSIVRTPDTDDSIGTLWNAQSPDELREAGIIAVGEDPLFVADQLEYDSRQDIGDKTTTLTDKYVNIYDSNASESHIVFSAAIPRIRNDRAFEIKDTQIDTPKILLPHDDAHLASRGRIGYDFESAMKDRIGTRWHWTGYVTDFVYEKPNLTDDDLDKRHGGKFYFLYTIPLDKITEISDTDYNILGGQIRSKLIEYNVDDDSYKILFMWDRDLLSTGLDYERGEFWALAHNETFTEFYILATRSKTDADNVAERASYDSLEINDGAIGKVVIIKVFKDMDTNEFTSVDFVTSTTGRDRYTIYKPQLAHFYGFSVLGGSSTPSFQERLRGLPDNRRAFFINKHGSTEYLYYPYVRSIASTAVTPDASPVFGYARIPISNDITTNLSETSAVQPLLEAYYDDRHNHMGFDMVFDSRDKDIFYFGFVSQEIPDTEDVIDNDTGVVTPARPKTLLKIVKVTIL